MMTLRAALADYVASLPVGGGHPTQGERDALVDVLRSGKLTAAQEAREYVQVLDEAYEVINWTREDARR